MERTTRLAALGADGLGRLLQRRPDVLVGRPPRTLTELAQRLDSGPSVAAACWRLDAARLQVLIGVAAFAGGVSVERLSTLLDGDPRPQLHALVDLDLVSFDHVTARIHPSVRRCVPDPFGLGPPFADIAEAFSHRHLQRAERAFGLPAGASKRATVEALARVYGDEDLLRRHASALPEPVVSTLLARAARLNVDHDYVDDDFFEKDDGSDAFDDWERDAIVEQVGLDTGLLIGQDSTWGQSALMPSEVALALRGPEFRMRFDPQPPTVAWLPVSRIDSDAAAAIAAFDGAATAVLDQISAKPAATVQAGGIGRRELQRIAKATSQDVGIVVLVIELAAGAGLLAAARPVVVTDAFATWRDSEPSARYVVLAAAWWEFLGRPGDERDADGAARRALTAMPCEQCRAARVVLLGALRDDVGLSLDDAVGLAAWHHPGAHYGDPPGAGPWAEAVALGVVAQGARTQVGRALVAGDDAALLAAATQALPASTSEAVFGSDLTAFVAGSPSSRVAGVLDACGTRESGGGAVTWRLSMLSVRRALDGGLPLEDLRSSLRDIAAGGKLPGAVEVLLDDVGRTWGRASVRDATGVVVSDDHALLVQMLHDRKLAALGLEPVAPTVLLATADAVATTAALRKAGYMPAFSGSPEPVDARAARPSLPSRRPVVPDRPVATADPFQVARRLLDAGTKPPEPSSTEEMLRLDNPRLSSDEVAVLAHALDTHSRVHIVYETAGGGISERVIRPSNVLGGRIWAWCELRHDDREFVIERVLGVRGV